jgi:hypothetical protein
LTAFVVKLIALATMFIDHLGAVFPMYFPFAFRVVGRIAFPLFVYFIAEGCRHTKDMRRYIIRLGIFAIVSQIPFDLAFSHLWLGNTRIDFFSNTNIFYTLFLGALCIYVFQRFKERNKYLAFASIIPILMLLGVAQGLATDYGPTGVLFIFVMYVIPKKIPRLAAMTLFLFYMYGDFIPHAVLTGLDFGPYMNLSRMGMLLGSLISVVCVAYYNGEKGPGMKWLFYTAYPTHLLLFAGVYQALIYYGIIF